MRKGFTLIEVLVVAVIVAVLAAVAIPAYNGYISNTKRDVAKNLAATIASEAAVAYAQTGTVTLSNLSAYQSVVDNADLTPTASGSDGVTVTHNTTSEAATVKFLY